MTKEEAKKFGLQLLHGIMERNGSYPVYANNVKQAIEALSEPDGSSEIPNDLEEAAKAYADDTNPTDSFYEAFKEGALWMREKMMDEWLKDRDGCFWDGVEEGKKAMREQMMKEAVEGVVSLQFADGTGAVRTTDGFLLNGLRCGDKVRIIIV